MKFIASASNGKDSVKMVLELIKRKWPLDLVLFFDGGKEFQAIYDTWNRLTAILDENGIAWDVIRPDNSFDYYFSEKPVNTRSGEPKMGYSWCGGIARWMTKIKTQSISKYYKEHFPDELIVEYIGIAADELDRVKAPTRTGRTIKMYPLILWGYTENDCFVDCYKAGFEWKENDVSLYQILDRVSCWCCGNKSMKELKNMCEQLPEYWKQLKEMQSKTEKPFRSDTTIFDLEERFKKESGKKC